MFRYLALVLSCSVLALLVGCSGGGVGDKSAVTPKAERKFVSIGSAPTGGAFFVIGGAIEAILNTNGFKATNEATKGSRENIIRMDKGEIEMGLVLSAMSYYAVRGEGGWSKKIELQPVLNIHPMVAQFITPKESTIKSIADLKGKRVFIGPAGAGFEAFVTPILDAHGIGPKDFTPINATLSDVGSLIGDKGIDAAFMPIDTPAMQEIAASGFAFLPYDEAARQKLAKELPFIELGTIPPGPRFKLEAPVDSLVVGKLQLAAMKKADPELVYTVAKLVYENRESIAEKHPAGKSIKPETVAQSDGLEFHPGALKYFAEAGIKVQE